MASTHQLVYFKASNTASSKNHWFFRSSFYCTLSLYITVLLWSAPIFTCINRTFHTGHPINVNWLPLHVVRSHNSVYFAVHFTLSYERNWGTWQENPIGADSQSLLVAQPSHIWWDYKTYIQDIIYALCAIETSCWHSLNSHYPYNLIYPHPCWDDSNYSYASLIRGGNQCLRPFRNLQEVNRSGVSVGWTKKCKLLKHKLKVISTTCKRVGFFGCDIFSVEQIAHGKYDCRTVIFAMIFYRSLASESSVTGLGVHTRWWMYGNITLHSLCYLERVKPVVCTITHYPLELRSTNLDQMCKIAWLRSL